MEKYFVKVGDEEYYPTVEGIQKLLDDHTSGWTAEQNKLTDYSIFDDLPNPGVRVTTVYGNYAKVEVAYNYKSSPLPDAEAGNFNFPKKSRYETGDEAVTTTSAITAPLKWIHEHKNGDVANAHPVRLVEMCSSYNPTVNVNTERNFDNGELTYTESGYNGLECTCT